MTSRNHDQSTYARAHFEIQNYHVLAAKRERFECLGRCKDMQDLRLKLDPWLREGMEVTLGGEQQLDDAAKHNARLR